MEYEKTRQAIEKLPEELQDTAKEYLKDIEYWSGKVEQLQGYETFETKEVNRNGKQVLMTRKTPAHDMLKEAQQQKVNLQRALTVLFKKNIADEEDEFDKWIKGEDA